MKIHSRSNRSKKKQTPESTIAIPRQFLVLRVLSFFFLAVAVALLASMVWFMYTHVEQSLTQADGVLLLKTELSVESIDFERFDAVSARWEQKHSTSSPTVLYNPFFVTAAPVLTTTTPVIENE